jgi:hypothetical protein
MEARMSEKSVIEAQDCRLCPKRDESGNCTRPGVCIYVDKLADGESRMKESSIDPQLAERLGETRYLSHVNKMDIARYRDIFGKNPKLSKIITLLIAKVPWKTIEENLHVSMHTIVKANKLWQEMKEMDTKSR